ncbi:di-heme oxidoredictase family protein [Nostoc sp. TCL26-01]|uniref:di-heme oxidoredictase family protein n=1 Tax=Nostoc sp. TCL26-01 TaxID=2576904 RepID=UPI0015BD0F5C|nr:di-heme oxidoredictase family protein [Nostoc sp. TCL26-01]QLE57903.1 hypothetical protein FD725_21725 [Nostoc sp. TCL26-01]
MTNQTAFAKIDLLQPAPTQPIGYYDYFGKLLSPQAASQLVASKGLDTQDPVSYEKIGAVHITQDLIAKGQNIFFNRKIGDDFGLQGVFGFGLGVERILPEITTAIVKLQGQPTTNLVITLEKDLKIGNKVFLRGSDISTGLKIPKGSFSPLGITAQGGITCVVCHASVSKQGDILTGVPNNELAISLLVALAPNSAAAFPRLNLNPLDLKYRGKGQIIRDSKGNKVELPDPDKFERAFDDAVLSVPFGNFESSTDGISNTTQIPSVFTFQRQPYGFSGESGFGPFAGLSSLNNSVHSSEINLLAAAQLSQELLGIDPEVYIGIFLQNAANPNLRIQPGFPGKPSDWLRTILSDPTQAELQDQVPAPGTGTYPNLKPNLFTFNGLVFSPNTSNSTDIASGKFMFANNAMSAFQNSLVPPANRTPENELALKNNSVRRGAKVFEKANCASCHIPPFFTDNKIYPLNKIQTNPARSQARLAFKNLLVAPKLYSFNTPVPIPANAEVIDVPTQGISDTPTTLPKQGYKTTSLLGIYASAPYLHDSGVAVREKSLTVYPNGTFTIADPSGLGLPGTLRYGIPADAASSLRALVDRNLRTKVIEANQKDLGLRVSNIDGTGHNFYVDWQAGFNPQQQTDLINFLLALDNDPGSF